MEKLTYDQIVEKLEELKITPEAFARGYHYEDEDEVDTEKILESTFGNVEYIEDTNSGDGNDAYLIRHFVDHDVYIKVDYYYSSHGDNYYDNSKFEHVYPAETTVKVYKNVDGSLCWNIVRISL